MNKITITQEEYEDLLADRRRLEWLLDQDRTIRDFPSDDSGLCGFCDRSDIDDWIPDSQENNETGQSEK